ncbi:MAG: DUF4397 domain-containing protein [Actinomycetota bacterium]
MSRVRVLLAVLAALALALVTTVAGPAAAQDGARIHLIHGIPDVDVDVEANGANVFEGFSFGDTQDLSSLAGAELAGVKVKAAGTDTVAIDAGDLTLPDSGNTTIIAHLDADGDPTISIFSNDTSTIDAGEGRIIVRHTAAAPAVDIKANGDVAFAGVENGQGGGADLPTGTISAEVVPAGADEPVVIGPADLPINEGEALIVYAVGSLEAGNLSVLTETITGLHGTPTEVNTGTSAVSDGLGLGALAAALGAMVVLGGGGLVLARRSQDA